MKRLFDILISIVIITLISPILLLVGVLIFLTDFQSPFYIAERVGKDFIIFKMIKLRSMRNDVSLKSIVSTSLNDPRITKIGRIIRKYKIDEFSQFLNVVSGHMSIVGPRPNVKVEVDLYTRDEKQILLVKPGITDLASIVFFDLNEILKYSKDPNTDYNQLIRPWKSRLALFYVYNRSLNLDFKIILITILSFFNRRVAMNWVARILKNKNAQNNLIDICKVEKVLYPFPPPGSNSIVSADFRKSINNNM